MKKNIHTNYKSAIPPVTDIVQLAQLLEMNLNELLLEHNDAIHNFPLQVPSSFVARMHKRNRYDPLLLQILPQKQEVIISKDKDSKEYSTDPLCEASCSPLPGILHKYRGRALLLLTKNCPINCRFCFRRYIRQQVENWPQVFAYLANNQTISEIILSGGEPLLWGNKKLNWLLQQLVLLPHIKRVRIHTRAPIVIPERISNDLLHMLAKQKLPIVFVVHCNHPQEIDTKVALTLKKIRANNFTLLNQSVLLKGINDNEEILAELSEKLFAAGVLPYYLHMLDKVKGAAHFCVDVCEAKTLLATMQQLLPGYLVPKLVRDVVGEKAKKIIG